VSGELLWIDASAGAAGDMLLAALVDAGAPLTEIRRGLTGLSLPGWTLRSRRVTTRGIAARRIDVRVRGDQPARGRRELHRILRRASLDPAVRRTALAVFDRLLAAEAAVHGVDLGRVHLHEAGGVDAIVDVVGVSLALARLAPRRIVVGPMTTGFGRVRCTHGDYPVPAPATLELVKGLPVRSGDVEAERLTPTGAAILTAIADDWGPMPPMRPRRVGLGAGSREIGDAANVVRVVLGEADEAATGLARLDGEIVVIECNVDDATPQALAHAVERLLEAGAYDAALTPIVMKKGRPGHLLRVLCAPERAPELTDAVLRQTTTLGLRWRRESRIELARELRRVRTPFGTVRVKLGRLDGEVVQAWPEYEDCAALARRHGVPLQQVQHAALRAEAAARPSTAAPNGRGRRRR